MHAVKSEMCEVMHLPLQAKHRTLPSASVGKAPDDNTTDDADQVGEMVVTPAQADVSNVRDDVVEERVAMKVEPAVDQSGDMVGTPAEADVRDVHDDVVQETVAVKVEPDDDAEQSGERVGTPAQREHPPVPLLPKVVVMRDGVATDVQTAAVQERVRVEQVDALPQRERRSARCAGEQAAVEAQVASSVSEKEVVDVLPATRRKSERHAVTQTGVVRHKKCAESASKK